MLNISGSACINIARSQVCIAQAACHRHMALLLWQSFPAFLPPVVALTAAVHLMSPEASLILVQRCSSPPIRAQSCVHTQTKWILINNSAFVHLYETFYEQDDLK